MKDLRLNACSFSSQSALVVPSRLGAALTPHFSRGSACFTCAAFSLICRALKGIVQGSNNEHVSLKTSIFHAAYAERCVHNAVLYVAPVRDGACVRGLFVDTYSCTRTDEALGVAAVGLQ